jgi:mercuric ion transport protein
MRTIAGKDMATTADGFWKRHLDKLGIGGALFAALCCLGFPALISIVSAIGLGFLINDTILMPLLGISLLVTLAGLYLGVRHHGSWIALILGAASAVALFVFIAVAMNKALAYLSIAGLVAAGFLNVWLHMKRRREQRGAG